MTVCLQGCDCKGGRRVCAVGPVAVERVSRNELMALVESYSCHESRGSYRLLAA